MASFKIYVNGEWVDPVIVVGDSRYLIKSNNLSDLTDVPAARSNLGLGAAALLSVPIAPEYGGTGIANPAGATLDIGAATTISGGGTISLGGFTLSVPATLTAAGINIANVFTAAQKINVNSTTAFFVEQDGVKDNVFIVDTTNAYIGVNKTPSFTFDVLSATHPGIVLTNNVTDATLKDFAMAVRHYTNAEEPAAVFTYSAGSVNNQLIFGGGAGYSVNAATLMLFYTAANNTTVGGTERLRINSSGLVGVSTPSGLTARFQVGGLTDIVQVRILANPGQTASIQTWETSGGTVLSNITAAGRYIQNIDGPSVRLTNTGAGTGDFQLRIDSANGYLALSEASTGLDPFIIYKGNGNGIMVIRGTKVGIGINPPVAMLDVSDFQAGHTTVGAFRVFRLSSYTAASTTHAGEITIQAPNGNQSSSAYTGLKVIAQSNTTASAVLALTGASISTNWQSVSGVAPLGVAPTVTSLVLGLSNTGAGTITTGIMLDLSAPINSGGGAITTAYGIRIGNVSVGTTNYAIYTNAGLVRFGGKLTVSYTGTLTSDKAGYVNILNNADVANTLALEGRFSKASGTNTQTGVNASSGVVGTITLDGGSATWLVSLHAKLSTTNSPTLTNYVGYFVSTPNLGGTPTVTNIYGFYAEDITGGANNYAIYTNAGFIRFGDVVAIKAAPDARYLLYSDASMPASANTIGIFMRPNFYGSGYGSVFQTSPYIRTTATITALYHIYLGGVTNSGGAFPGGIAQYGLYITDKTELATNWAIYTNLGLVHFGDSLDLSNGKSITLVAGDILTDTTTGSRLGGSAAQKWAIWGKTPIVQPTTAITPLTFVANTSGIADDTATWGGYTGGQIAAALKDFGILA